MRIRARAHEREGKWESTGRRGKARGICRQNDKTPGFRKRAPRPDSFFRFSLTQTETRGSCQ